MKRKTVSRSSLPFTLHSLRFTLFYDLTFTLGVVASASTLSPIHSPASAWPGTPHRSQYQPRLIRLEGRVISLTGGQAGGHAPAHGIGEDGPATLGRQLLPLRHDHQAVLPRRVGREPVPGDGPPKGDDDLDASLPIPVQQSGGLTGRRRDLELDGRGAGRGVDRQPGRKCGRSGLWARTAVGPAARAGRISRYRSALRLIRALASCLGDR